MGTFVLSRTVRSAVTLSGGTGSSIQVMSYGSMAFATAIAEGTLYMPWASMRTSMSGPTASRTAASFSIPSRSPFFEMTPLR